VATLPPDAVRSGSPVTAVTRGARGSTVVTADGTRESFDAVVMATHADDALRLLVDADPREQGALGAFEYTTNDVVLHTDDRLLPRRGPARASWNVETDDCRRPPDTLTMTYDMNRLQTLPGRTRYLVSVNPGGRIRPERVISTAAMSHPRYTFRTLQAQAATQRSRATGAPSSPERTWDTGSTRTAAARATRRWSCCWGPHRSARHEVSPA